MDILSYVQELLQKQTEVCVNGLGTFYKKKSAGRYDKVKKSFVPPSYILQFNATQNKDESLAQYIAGQKNISIEGANYFIEKFVAEIEIKLEEEHEAELEHLGRLYFTEHEGLTFDPAKNINLGSEFFGLPEITPTLIETAPKIENEEEVHEEISEAPSPTPQQPEFEIVNTQNPEIENVILDEVEDDINKNLQPSHFVTETTVEQIPTETPTLEPEIQKTYLHLDSEEIVEKESVKEEVTEAPQFIQDQHFEHPNRFGHETTVDPNKVEHNQEPVATNYSAQNNNSTENLSTNTVEEEYEEEEKKSPWIKILIAFIVLLLIGTGIYLANPNLFTSTVEKEPETLATMDTVVKDSVNSTLDSAQIKQDSIAKTDSILKAHAVKPVVKKDTVALNSTPVKPIEVKEGPVTYDIIAASFKTEAKAALFVEQMKKYGITAKIISLPERKLKKISIASFKTEKEAYEKRPELAKKINIEALDIIKINTNQ